MGEIHEIETYVRFCDTDALGHVNNTRHFQYFEEARTKFFKAVYPERSTSFSFILASISCDYLAQAYADQILKVTTFVMNIGNKSFTLKHVLTNNDTGEKVAESSGVVVCFDYHKQHSIAIPEKLNLRLGNYLMDKQYT